MSQSLPKKNKKTTQETKTTTQKTRKLFKKDEKIFLILKYIKNNPKITRKELAEKIGITPDGVKYNLMKLKNKNIIERVGATKGGRWKILKNS